MTDRTPGDLVVGGERLRFDGVGQRDHSWGFRHWAGAPPVEGFGIYEHLVTEFD